MLRSPSAVRKRLVILTAFGLEFDELRSISDQPHDIEHISGIRIVESSYLGVPLTIVQTGIGMVNASMATQYVICKYGSSNILGIWFNGLAGGPPDRYPVGAVVIPKRWVNHGMQMWKTLCGDIKNSTNIPLREPGYTNVILPGDKCKKPEPNHAIMEINRISRTGQDEYRFYFPVDTSVYRAAKSVSKKLDFLHVGGTGASADIFMDDERYTKYLQTSVIPDVLVFDMESQAVAQTAERNGVPFIAIRLVSDVVGSQPEDISSSKLPTERLTLVTQELIKCYFCTSR